MYIWQVDSHYQTQIVTVCVRYRQKVKVVIFGCRHRYCSSDVDRLSAVDRETLNNWWNWAAGIWQLLPLRMTMEGVGVVQDRRTAADKGVPSSIVCWMIRRHRHRCSVDDTSGRSRPTPTWYFRSSRECPWLDCRYLEHIKTSILSRLYGCSLLRGTVVRTLVFDRRTFLSHARPAADGWPLMWVNRPL